MTHCGSKCLIRPGQEVGGATNPFGKGGGESLFFKRFGPLPPCQKKIKNESEVKGFEVEKTEFFNYSRFFILWLVLAFFKGIVSTAVKFPNNFT